VHYQASVDVRYRGQGYELNLPFTKSLLPDFQQEHHRRYGYAHPDRELELVTLRLRATVPTATPGGKIAPVGTSASTVQPSAARGPSRAQLGSPSTPPAPVLFDGKKLATAIHSRDAIKPGQAHSGPAIVTEYSATTVIPPNHRFELDRFSNLIITIR
jgi:N-methylhydantoinase A